jgi:DNA-binding PadR family transcriptional regulator
MTLQTPVNFHPLPPLTPSVFHILLALFDRERHGYGIMLEVERSTAGELKMGPGTLYGSIKRMMAAGLVEESDTRPDPQLDDQRRRYYRLTPLGRRTLTAETTRLAQMLRVAQTKGAAAGASSRKAGTKAAR